MATGLASWSTTAASNSTADSAVNMAEGIAPSIVNDGIRALMASAAKWRDDVSGTLTTGGTSTAYTITSNQSFASLTALNGHMLYIKLNATNGASPTLAVDGLTAKALTTDGSTAVPTGALVSGSIWGVTYSSSSGAFIVHSPPSTAASFTTLAVSGATTLSGTLAAGNTTITGTLDVSGNVTVNTNKFTVAASTGNTVVAGTLGVTGAATLSSSISAASATGSMIATQADQETGTSTTTLVSPGRQHFHPTAAKCRLKCASDATVAESHNITSATNTGAGIVDVTIATDFSNTDYAIVLGGGHGSSNAFANYDSSAGLAAGTFRMRGVNGSTAGAVALSSYSAACFGDHA